MKKLVIYSAVLCLLAATATMSWAADPYGQEQFYRIVTYSFSSGKPSDSSAVTGNTAHYNPLMISGARSEVPFSSTGDQDQFTYTSNRIYSQGFALSADINATSKLSFQGVIGITKNGPATLLNSNFDSSWEANLGVIYKLFNHLSYEMHFGFMDSGSLFKTTNTYSDTESVVMISNQLTMSF